MFEVDPTTKKITMHAGDTGAVIYHITGYDLRGEDARIVWTMKNTKGIVVKSGVYTPDENEIRVEFANADTDTLDPGTYIYDLRIVIDPEFDTEGNLVDGTDVNTPISPLYVEILETVGDI